MRNDTAQYDRLAEHWWRADGEFAMLHWLAAARAALLPPAGRPGALLVDLGCGGGLLAPHVARLGYTHVGVDLVGSALRHARAHGVLPIKGDVLHPPLREECADVVVAGEILEHVSDLDAAVTRACRLLRPGGLLVLDTIADTALARFVAVTVAERIPGLAPRDIHDPALFVDRDRLVRVCAREGVALALRGIRPAAGQLVRWLATRRGSVELVPSRLTGVLFQGRGTKEPG
jgi:2-polyprenyl-6-hydroxyphenyl methylase/3-demethylubiquinone-9 3-methyltransferase